MKSTKYATLLAFDYGRRRIGIAVGQSVTCSATPLTTLTCVNQKPDWSSIEALIATWKPDALVVGLPMHMDGGEHEMSKAARRFGNQLHGRYGLPVELVDERLTSIEASSRLSKQNLSKKKRHDKKTLDTIAAQLILESWFAQTHNAPPA